MNPENKEEILKKLNKEFPFIPYLGISQIYSTVKRMKAEKELNIPLTWRAGFAISVKTGKRGYEMNEEEWNQFYYDLCENLKRDYPDMYDRVFPVK